jgi:oligopeptide/dipeptide ABC transporter ATP-binding protein
MLLEVEHLKTYFYMRRGVVRSVNDISFSIAEGETLGLVGESGSGKSTVALSLLRLVPSPGKIVGGKIKFSGVDLLTLPEGSMRRYRGRHLSMILQDPLSSLNPVFRIGEQIGEGIKIHDRLKGKPLRQRIQQLMRLVGIPDPPARINSYPHHFSGGMRQRVVGAISLACRPRFLIADEPTTSLDVTIQQQYLNLLKDLQRREQLTMMFVTHDFGVVAKMCDHVAVMYAGLIVEKAPLREIFDHPVHPYTKALMASVPKMETRAKRLPTIEGQPPSLLNLPKGCPFVTRCPERLDKCSEMPPEIEIRSAHHVKCWRYA